MGIRAITMTGGFSFQPSILNFTNTSGKCSTILVVDSCERDLGVYRLNITKCLKAAIKCNVWTLCTQVIYFSYSPSHTVRNVTLQVFDNYAVTVMIGGEPFTLGLFDTAG